MMLRFPVILCVLPLAGCLLTDEVLQDWAAEASDQDSSTSGDTGGTGAPIESGYLIVTLEPEEEPPAAIWCWDLTGTAKVGQDLHWLVDGQPALSVASECINENAEAFSGELYVDDVGTAKLSAFSDVISLGAAQATSRRLEFTADSTNFVGVEANVVGELRF